VSETQAVREQRRAKRQLGSEGDRPPGPFGSLPVSEIAIFAGVVGATVGFVQGGGPALIVGLVVCVLGVLEVTAREHLSGFRAHTTLLAAIPTALLALAIAALIGQPRQHSAVLLAVVPVFALLFWLLRRRFSHARQARVARPPRR